MKGLKILSEEAKEFVLEGSRINIVNPQSNAEVFDGKYLIVDGKRKLDLTRLDYLGLGSNHKVRDIMKNAIEGHDISCPASQMIMKAAPNIKLEKALANFHGMSESIVYTTGYAANENVIQALGLRMNTPHIAPYVLETKMGKSSRSIPTIFFIDEDSHFSMQAAARNAKLAVKDKCQVYKFPAGNHDGLQKSLGNSMSVGPAVRIIISDTLSSTSGRMFDVKALCEIAEEYDCLLYLDEAHAVGALGPQGRGIANAFGDIEKYRDRMIIMGTLTKVFCQLGGYVTMSSRYLSWYLRVCSPHYLFSAPVPPWMAETLVQMITLISGEFGDIERAKLADVAGHLRQRLLENGFNILDSNSHIVPVSINDDVKAAKVKEYLLEKGFVASFFGYPAVKRGESLIRFSLCADITKDEIDSLMKTMLSVREKFMVN